MIYNRTYMYTKLISTAVYIIILKKPDNSKQCRRRGIKISRLTSVGQIAFVVDAYTRHNI